MSFSVIEFFFLVGFQKLSFLTTWPKNAHPQNTIEVSAFFQKKNICVTKRPVLDQKPDPEIPVIILFCLFLLFKTTKTQTIAKPLFLWCFSKRKNNFQRLNLKQRKIAPFLGKRRTIFRTLPDNWAQKNIK